MYFFFLNSVFFTNKCKIEICVIIPTCVFPFRSDSRNYSPFPNKWANPLPGIHARGISSPNEERSMMVYNHDQALEKRVVLAEQSNKALLEEVVRLQSEQKTIMRRTEDELREEKNARKQVENSCRASNDLISQLAQRLQRTDDKLHESQKALMQLTNHQRSMEEALLGNQKEMVSRRDVTQTRSELKVLKSHASKERYLYSYSAGAVYLLTADCYCL